ncbi:MAG: CYTH domain-containing protein [Candidatus Micrarchaeota archaeon]|nr:CYTH domain-containing protein [Candidatus Micrarchaeota archaeon]
MKKVKELELKFQVLDKNWLEKLLKNLKFLKKVRTKDIYLDTEDAELYKRGIFMRIRDGSKLQIKFNPSDVIDQNKISEHDVCLEYSFDLPLSEKDVDKLNDVFEFLNLKQISTPSLDELKNKNNLIDSIIIDKERKIFTDGKFSIVVDDVKELGTFIEIEAKVSEEEDIDIIKNEMLRIIDGQKVKKITTGYNELWWRKRNFEIYLQGRYLLEEDYKKLQDEARNPNITRL